MDSETLPQPEIRALFLDIDGTLARGPDDPVSPGVRRAVERARERGCQIVLCTGRTRFTAEPVARELGPPYGYIITSNGGVVTHIETGEVLYRRLLSIPLALRLIHAIIEVGGEPYVYEDSDVAGSEGSRVLYHPDLPVGPFAIAPRYRPHATILHELPFAPISVSAFGATEKMRPLAERLRQELPDEVSIIESGSKYHWGVEIYVANVDKRAGLEAVATRLGVDRAEIMAIG